ncbi:hypothetical protein [Roseivirga misakiensis]|uniref:Uncharacterized protein n=1 Tax=Roseivirga misakiensis TaxID=1563681 RepID=A0A1E5SY43_9BACT|nr:hypothetical protein [Roseivirga misakiensis]OEK04032.1 hypothetical protein BFP71_11080 [Roseivirga misakiensis]
MKNYIYLDAKRIDSYYDQLMGFKTEEDYFSVWPKWVGGLNISTSSPTKPVYSLYEKSVAVAEYIKSSNQFLPKRHAPYPLCKKDYVYYEETLTASRIEVQDKLSLWISESTSLESTSENSKYGHLLLIEDYRRADGDVKFLGSRGMSQLLTSHGIGLKLSKSEEQELSLKPIEFLKTKANSVFEPMKITALYRLIDWNKDLVNDKRICTLGYALLIAQS